MQIKLTTRTFRRNLRLKLFQMFLRYSTNSPYISGDSIAECCDYYAFGRFENQRIDLKKLSKAKSIFVPGHLLIQFLHDYGTYINASSIVSGNSDENFTVVPELPPSVSLFLCQNLELNDIDFAHTLPIGLENIRLGRSGRTSFHKYQSSFPIVNKILVPPMSPTNPFRALALRETQLRPEIFDVYSQYMNERTYFALTRKYKFILSLEGNGYENHRIWESLYQGSIPVMLNSNWSRSLLEYHLPILFVDSISDISLELISEFNRQFGSFHPKEINSLWIPFWRAAIQSGKMPDKLTDRKS